MTLPEFLLRWNERPVLWGFVRPWVPARTTRYSWRRVAALTGLAAGLCALGAMVPFGVLFSGLIVGEKNDYAIRLLPWIAGTAAEFGACVGLCVSLVSRVCWNQRAARLAAAPDSPEATAPWPRVGFWASSISGLFYTVIVGLVTPLLLFHAIENTRGAWAWRNYQAELKAKGECFELPCIIPPPVRDEENFFATPFWQQFAYREERTANGTQTNIWLHGSPFDYTTNFALPEEPKAVKRTAGFAEQLTDGRLDLVGWAAQLRFSTTNTAKVKYDRPRLLFPLSATPGEPAADVLLALTKFDATLAELAAASLRPRNRYPLHYEEGFNALLPHLASMKSTTRICQLRAAARLDVGDSAGAAADTLLAYRMGEALSDEPLLISQLVHFACDGIAHHALWEGLVAHRWTDAQLATFQERLGRLDYAGVMARALEGERALGNESMEQLLRHHGRSLDMLDNFGGAEFNSDPPGVGSVIGSLVPTGWFRQNQIGLLRGYQSLFEHARAAMTTTHRATRRPGDESDDYLRQIAANPSPFNIMVKMLLPALGKSIVKAERAQTLARMAGVACALERHHLAHGTFPATLGELVPAYLAAVPEDWMSGQPLHYERTDDGWYRLWSVGPNRQDDGGIYRKQDGKGVSEDLDWPWPTPVPSRAPRLF